MAVKKRKKKETTISQSTLKRMSDYLCVLNYLKEQGIDTVSSSVLSKMMNVTDSQIRKDLSYFGTFGKRGVGYQIDQFINAIEHIMNMKNEHRVCIIGMGRLGSALANYKRVKEMPYRVVAGFDNDKSKIGTSTGGVKIFDIEQLSDTIDSLGCEIAIITVPSYEVYDVYARLSKTNVSAILNFTPIILKSNEEKIIRNFDFVSELKIISYLLKEKENAD